AHLPPPSLHPIRAGIARSATGARILQAGAPPTGIALGAWAKLVVSNRATLSKLTSVFAQLRRAVRWTPIAADALAAVVPDDAVVGVAMSSDLDLADAESPLFEPPRPEVLVYAVAEGYEDVVREVFAAGRRGNQMLACAQPEGPFSRDQWRVEE